ncbi:predicted protein [Histoplasma capsulatum var. duboisii H88]|uniref:Predicted protein n=1 Tax=Ajellomyces capsulatus (strain H88) TaxID=544711 RepID=F0UDB5_AJEC8|nr:predicted protein [Histoplasma capsulatum var. duboisii H88]
MNRDGCWLKEAKGPKGPRTGLEKEQEAGELALASGIWYWPVLACIGLSCRVRWWGKAGNHPCRKRRGDTGDTECAQRNFYQTELVLSMRELPQYRGVWLRLFWEEELENGGAFGGGEEAGVQPQGNVDIFITALNIIKCREF